MSSSMMPSSAYQKARAPFGLPRNIKARFQFQEASEIFIADTELEQNAVVPTNVPSMVIPTTAVASISAGMLMQKLKYGCFLRVLPGSGFPFVIVRDGARDNGAAWESGTYKTDPRNGLEDWIVGPEGRWIPPLSMPMILPPTERYYNGFGTTEALYPIGGIASDDGFQTVTSAYLKWEVNLEASDYEFPSTSGPRVWSGAFIKQLLTAGADKYLYTPLFALIESEGIGAANMTLAGSMGINAPAVMTGIYMTFRGYAYDRDTALQNANMGPIADASEDINIQKELMTAYCFLMLFTADFVDPNQADIPALTHFQVTL